MFLVPQYDARAVAEQKRRDYARSQAVRPPYSFYTGTPMRTQQMKRQNPYAQMPRFLTSYKKPRTQLVMPNRPRVGYPSVARTRGVGVQGEMKYFDTEVVNDSISVNADWTGTVEDPVGVDTLFAPGVGPAYNQRIGKSAKIMKLKLHGTVHCSPHDDMLAAPYGVQIRLLLVQDCQTNSVQMGGEQLMTPSSAGALVGTNNFQNVNNFGRFRVWKDKTITFDNTQFDGAAPAIYIAGRLRHFKWSLKFAEGLQVRFGASGGTIADIVDNSFHVVALASNNIINPSITYRCRVCFKE